MGSDIRLKTTWDHELVVGDRDKIDAFLEMQICLVLSFSLQAETIRMPGKVFGEVVSFHPFIKVFSAGRMEIRYCIFTIRIELIRKIGKHR